MQSIILLYTNYNYKYNLLYLLYILLRVCSLLCVHLDGLNAEHKFQVWVTILGHTPLPFPLRKQISDQQMVQSSPT